MKITILTLFPEMFEGFLTTSIIKKARLKELVTIDLVDIRGFTQDKHNRVDDTPYGGGQGMVLMCQPVLDALESVKGPTSRVLLMSPQGRTFKQSTAREFVRNDHLILICGHYEGFDERIRYYVDEEVSIGDYVLTGGELASMIVTDATVRLIQGVITEQSHLEESFENGLLEYPQYTRPTNYEGHVVPEVLLSGHHENIRKWRLKESLRKTKGIRQDLLKEYPLDKESKKLLDEIISEAKKD